MVHWKYSVWTSRDLSSNSDTWSWLENSTWPGSTGPLCSHLSCCPWAHVHPMTTLPGVPALRQSALVGRKEILSSWPSLDKHTIMAVSCEHCALVWQYNEIWSNRRKMSWPECLYQPYPGLLPPRQSLFCREGRGPLAAAPSSDWRHAISHYFCNSWR